ncbi:hypothetical protein JXM67_11625 [candidate division WOR-3 bacterium]|nr:hypothetical protein [candidate division WOR-3 bacterium]
MKCLLFIILGILNVGCVRTVKPLPESEIDTLIYPIRIGDDDDIIRIYVWPDSIEERREKELDSIIQYHNEQKRLLERQLDSIYEYRKWNPDNIPLEKILKQLAWRKLA